MAVARPPILLPALCLARLATPIARPLASPMRERVGTVIWIFEREEERAVAEIIHVGPRRHALRFVDGEGVERFEHFKSAKDAQTGMMDLAKALGVLGWRRTRGDDSDVGAKATDPGQPTEGLTDQSRFMRWAQEAVQEAERRALARGLTEPAIQREAEDTESQYWDDVRETIDRLRQTHIH